MVCIGLLSEMFTIFLFHVFKALLRWPTFQVLPLNVWNPMSVILVVSLRLCFDFFLCTAEATLYRVRCRRAMFVMYSKPIVACGCTIYRQPWICARECGCDLQPLLSWCTNWVRSLWAEDTDVCKLLILAGGHFIDHTSFLNQFKCTRHPARSWRYCNVFQFSLWPI